MLISIVSFIFVIGVCVIIHEGGHYLMAVWRGVQVHEFAFGMGPKIVSKRGKETLWSLRAFPIGGFVRLEGMEDDPLPEDKPDPARAFPIKKAWERFLIIAGGAAANIVLAWILTAALLSFHGILDLESPVVGKLIEGYPAATMGAEPGDRVVSINGVKIEKWGDIRQTLQEVNTDTITIGALRDGQEITLSGRVPFDDARNARLWGVEPSTVKYPLHQAFAKSLGHCWAMSMEILRSISQIITGNINFDDVGGPVKIADMAGSAAKAGFWTLITFLAVINLNLGMINLLPFPALDGGRLVFIVGEMIFRRKFPEAWENRIHLVGFALLMVLIVVITWNDITSYF